MPEFKNTVVWVNDSQSEIYFSFYDHNTEDPLCDVLVTGIDSIVTYEKESGKYGPCFSVITKDFSDEELHRYPPFKDIINHTVYEAMRATDGCGLRLGEIYLKLQNGIEIGTLLGGDLLVRNSNMELNSKLIKHCIKSAHTLMDPFSIYMVSDEGMSLIRTKYETKCISDFVLGSPDLFLDMPE